MKSKFFQKTKCEYHPIKNLVLQKQIKLLSSGICLIPLQSYRMAICDSDGFLFLYPDQSMYRIHNGPIFTAKKYQNLLLTGSGDMSFNILDLQNLKPIVKKTKAHENSLKVIIYEQRNHKMILTGARDGKIRIWDYLNPNKQKIDQIKLGDAQNQSVTGIQIIQNNYILATHSNQKNIFVYDLRKTKNYVAKIQQQLSKINKLRYYYKNISQITSQTIIPELIQAKNIIRMNSIDNKLLIHTSSYISLYDINSLDCVEDITFNNNNLSLGHHSRSSIAYDSIFVGDLAGNLHVLPQNGDENNIYKIDLAHNAQINDVAQYKGLQGIIASVGDDQYFKIWNNSKIKNSINRNESNWD